MTPTTSFVSAPTLATSSTTLLPIPSRAKRHLLSRFSYGVTPELVDAVRGPGGGRAWFDQQLDPEAIPDSFADELINWYPRLPLSARELWDSRPGGTGFLDLQLCRDFQNWTLLRRISSRRQLHEVMTEFWSNLLHVPIPSNKTWTWRFDYDRTIRRHALGRFDEMLEAAELHPAMLSFLDQAKSTAKAINENLGRELLELHTVSRDAGFTEDEVRDSSRILTGWHVDMYKTWELSYQPANHWVGPVQVMGFSSANNATDGQQLTRDYLRYLAHHPATARRIARSLAVRFVSDSPSRALVDHLASVFTASGTDIKSTLLALIEHRQFLRSHGKKVRTPMEDLAATYRAMQVEVLPPSGQESDAASSLMQVSLLIGQRPFEWGRPDGFPDIADAWTSTSRMLGSFRAHWNTVGGYSPRTGVRYQEPAYFFPELPASLQACVEHACRKTLGRGPSPSVLTAVSQATDTALDTTITVDHPMLSHKFPRLMTTLLDSPLHMNR